MAARKLQTEIDQALKKVAEGVDLFESTYEKMQASTNQSQKEKLEAALKNQIKKLQRHRDQIRTWVANNDIKDKSRLLEARQIIETQMEKFKACEKEVKKKAFSNVALGEALEKLQIQVEQAEAEIESLQGSTKKKPKGAGNGRVEELEHLNGRRKWHISRLEIVLRMLNNGSLDADKVVALKEDVHYFVESNAEEDFTEYEGIYDDLNLDEEEERFRGGLDEQAHDSGDESDAVMEEIVPRAPTKKASEDSSKRADSPILKKSSSVQIRKQSDAKPPANFATQPMASILKPAAPRPPTILPPIRYSAAVQQSAPQPPPPPPPPSATAAVSQAPPPKPKTVPPASIPPPPSSVGAPSSPSMTHPSAASPMSSYASVSHDRDSSFYESPTLSEAVGAPIAVSSPQRRSVAIPSPAASTSRLVPEPGQAETTLEAENEQEAAEQQPVPQFPPGVKILQGEQATSGTPPTTIGGHRQPNGGLPPPALPPSSFPPGLADLVLPFERAKQKASQRMTNIEQLQKFIANGASSIPQPQDAAKAKYYVPRNPWQTPSYYPQVPHPAFNNAAIYSQVDVETLFYVFYFWPLSYPQYLAAEELKRQSWRFHIKYLTWFQRHSEPQAITEEYEQGVYVYFDWEGSWCQRKKADFRFEYRYLAEE
ncbi:Not1 N-terminal domain, CCR4-Not complex component-domain-containing protein [Roridomyces roridus]|uniref:General negative regulator of transcription subunit n=1 Tax=Roridomyces roridus TaxID=1738132 RepID=A0AAD7FV11_9AGAR|nr:Not1 N-terminal domain, CCR4-Not complex component-domain-containing protein [Roridomyces roridus]